MLTSKIKNLLQLYSNQQLWTDEEVKENIDSLLNKLLSSKLQILDDEEYTLLFIMLVGLLEAVGNSLQHAECPNLHEQLIELKTELELTLEQIHLLICL